MRRATWAPLGGMCAKLRRLVGRLSTLMVTSFAAGDDGGLGVEGEQSLGGSGVLLLREGSNAWEG